MLQDGFEALDTTWIVKRKENKEIDCWREEADRTVDGIYRNGLLMFGLRADFLVNMSASADVLAMAKVEVDLSTIPEGKNVCPTHQWTVVWK
jgi:hypothetical protein